MTHYEYEDDPAPIGGECDSEREDAIKAIEKEAYRSFMSFPRGVEYNENKGTVTLSPQVQANILLSVQNLRKNLGEALSVLGALKFVVKTTVEPLPDEVKKALVIADALIEDPAGVEMHGVDTTIYDQDMEDLQ